MDYLNLRLYDLALGTDARLPSGQVVLVDIDDISMLQIGRWPWSRPVIAALINRIAEGHPEALAIDILFAEVSARPHDDQLLRNACRTRPARAPASSWPWARKKAPTTTCPSTRWISSRPATRWATSPSTPAAMAWCAASTWKKGTCRPCPGRWSTAAPRPTATKP